MSIASCAAPLVGSIIMLTHTSSRVRSLSKTSRREWGMMMSRTTRFELDVVCVCYSDCYIHSNDRCGRRITRDLAT